MTNPFFLWLVACVGIVWGFLSGLFKNAHRISLRITYTVQVDLGCPAVFMTQDSLNGTQRDPIAIHYRRPGMSDRMETEIPDTSFFTEPFH